jgi:hypothetical protein
LQKEAKDEEAGDSLVTVEYRTQRFIDGTEAEVETPISYKLFEECQDAKDEDFWPVDEFDDDNF